MHSPAELPAEARPWGAVARATRLSVSVSLSLSLCLCLCCSHSNHRPLFSSYSSALHRQTCHERSQREYVATESIGLYHCHLWSPGLLRRTRSTRRRLAAGGHAADRHPTRNAVGPVHLKRRRVRLRRAPPRKFVRLARGRCSGMLYSIAPHAVPNKCHSRNCFQMVRPFSRCAPTEV